MIKLFLLFFLVSNFFADLIDVPTTDVVAFGDVGLGLRFYDNGFITYIDAGIKRLNIGGSIDVGGFFGREKISVRRPVMRFKWRVFDGTVRFPFAFVIGYDGQGYKYDIELDRYNEIAREIFFVSSIKHEAEKWGFDFNFGLNFNSEVKSLYGFLGGELIAGEVVGAVFEVDDVDFQKKLQLNLGLLLLIADNFRIVIMLKDVLTEPQRLVQVNWVKRIWK